MKAIVQDSYGSPDVLQLKDIDKPVVKDDEVLVRVRAAAVNIGDWHLLRGVPYVMRLGIGLRRPRREIPGLDIAGQVEAVGRNVKQFRPGDEVFGWCKGAFAEYACAAESNLLPKPANLTFEQSAAVGDSAFTALDCRSRSREGAAGAEGVDQRCVGRRRHVRRADREVVRSERDRRLQHEERRPGPIDRRGPGHRLHQGGLHPNRAALRRDARPGREPFVIGLQACADPPGHLRRGRRVEDLGRWFGLGRQAKALLLSPFVRQRMRVFVVRHNRDDLAVLKELVEAGKVAPVIDRRYALSEVPDALRHQGEGHAQGKIVIAA